MSKPPDTQQSDGSSSLPTGLAAAAARSNDVEHGMSQKSVSFTSTTALDPNHDGGSGAIETVSDLAQAAGVHFRMTEKISNIDMLLYRMFEDEMRAEELDDNELYKMLDSDEEEEDDEAEDEELALSYYRSHIKETYRRSQIALDTVEGGTDADDGEMPIAHTDYQI